VLGLDLELSRRFSQDLDSIIYTPAHDSYFVKDAERYSLGNNCNHLTARWLERLGCRIEGVVFGSHFKLKEPEAQKVPNTKSQAPMNMEITMVD
jgi:hypothetical protein